MSWQLLARHEARLTAATLSSRLLLGLLIVVSAMSGYVFPVFGDEPHTTAHFTGTLGDWMAMLVPLLGLVLGYNAIVGERASGSITLSLSLPQSRTDFVLGKFVGRSAVLAAGIVVAHLLATALVVYPFGELEILESLAFLGLTLVFGVVFTGIAVAVSTLSRSKRRVTVAIFAIYIGFVFLWQEVFGLVNYGLVSAGVDEMPAPLTIVFEAEPTQVYSRLVAGFLDPAADTSGAWYSSEWLALVQLLAWATIPLGLAIYRFDGVDL